MHTVEETLKGSLSDSSIRLFLLHTQNSLKKSAQIFLTGKSPIGSKTTSCKKA